MRHFGSNILRWRLILGRSSHGGLSSMGRPRGKLNDAGIGVPVDKGAGRPRKGETPPSQPNAAPYPHRRDTSRAGSSPCSNNHRVLCSALTHRANARARPCRRREEGRVAKEGREGLLEKPLPTKAGLHRRSNPLWPCPPRPIPPTPAAAG
jgi:hypothetical protein